MINVRTAAATFLLVLTATLTATPVPEAKVSPRVDRILKEVPLIDGHNDLPWQFRERSKNRLEDIDLRKDQSALKPSLHTDIPRLRQGRLGAQFWSVYVPTSMKGADAVQATIEQIDVVHRLEEIYPDTFSPALTADDIVRIHKQGKIASMVGVEGGHSINNSLAVLRQFYHLGARYMTLTHSSNNDWADSATDDPKHNGLTPFGRTVINEMNRLGMLVDLSHVSPKTMHDVLDTTQAPVIFSHSSARAFTEHPRNVPDDVLRRLKDNGGIVMITFVQGFVSSEARKSSVARDGEEARLKALFQGQPEKAKEALDAWDKANPAPRATVKDVANHIEHVIRIAGTDHIGIGADLDGITTTPLGLESVAAYPVLFEELIRRGHSDDTLRKLAGLNLLRVLRKSEAVAGRLRVERASAE